AILPGCRTKSCERVPAKKTSRPIARCHRGEAGSFRIHRQTRGATNTPQRCLPEHSVDARGNLLPCTRTCAQPTIASATGRSERESLRRAAQIPRSTRDVAAGEFFARKFPRPESRRL